MNYRLVTRNVSKSYMLPLNEVPEWLESAVIRKKEYDDKSLPIPFKDILKGSLYYPESGVDGTQLGLYAGYIHSFVYVDCGIREREVKEFIHSRPPIGYRCVLEREFRKDELPSEMKTAVKVKNMRSMLTYLMEDRDVFEPYHPFYGNWSVWEREEDLNDLHGPKLLSFMYCIAEAASLYNRLYVNLKASPRILSYIFGMVSYEKDIGMLVGFNHESRPLMLMCAWRRGIICPERSKGAGPELKEYSLNSVCPQLGLFPIKEENAPDIEPLKSEIKAWADGMKIPDTEIAGSSGITPLDVPGVKINIFDCRDNLTGKELYEKTRSAWKVKKKIRQRKIKYVFAIHRGKIKEIYRVTGWQKTDSHKSYSLGVHENQYYQFQGEIANSYIRDKYIEKYHQDTLR